jgi:hypothetical protein
MFSAIATLEDFKFLDGVLRGSGLTGLACLLGWPG